jgi:hypothetical protein
MLKRRREEERERETRRWTQVFRWGRYRAGPLLSRPVLATRPMMRLLAARSPASPGAALFNAQVTTGFRHGDSGRHWPLEEPRSTQRVDPRCTVRPTQSTKFPEPGIKRLPGDSPTPNSRTFQGNPKLGDRGGPDPLRKSRRALRCGIPAVETPSSGGTSRARPLSS